MRKFLLTTVFLLITSCVYAEPWICYEETTIGSTTFNQVSRRVVGDCLSLGICTGANNTGILANCFEAQGIEFQDAAKSNVKVDPGNTPGNRIVDMSQAEIDDIAAAQAASSEVSFRTSAKSKFDGQTIDGQSLRCLSDITRKEINILRTWTRDLKTETAASTSLANFQARVATLNTLTARTLSQLKNAMHQCIDDGDVDE